MNIYIYSSCSSMFIVYHLYIHLHFEWWLWFHHVVILVWLLWYGSLVCKFQFEKHDFPYKHASVAAWHRAGRTKADRWVSSQTSSKQGQQQRQLVNQPSLVLHVTVSPEYQTVSSLNQRSVFPYSTWARSRWICLQYV